MSQTATLGALAAEADDDLLIRYQQLDDHDAYAELDRRYRKQLVTYVCRFRGGVLRAAAEDIVQEAFLTFHKNRKRYARKNGVRALLYKIAIDRCGNHVERAEAEKRDHRRTVHPDGQHHIVTHNCEDRATGCAAVLPDPKADPAIRDRKIEVDELLGTLTPEQAEAVRLTRIEGHTAESAAKLVNIPAETMQKRASRGINALKEHADTDD